MGLLLRLCDSFCAADNMLGLFSILKEAATQVLALEHCRLWQVDRKRNVVVCVYHDGDDDACAAVSRLVRRRRRAEQEGGRLQRGA